MNFEYFYNWENFIIFLICNFLVLIIIIGCGEVIKYSYNLLMLAVKNQNKYWILWSIGFFVFLCLFSFIPYAVGYMFFHSFPKQVDMLVLTMDLVILYVFYKITYLLNS